MLSKYGIGHQKEMVIEECAELQKAVCKTFRYENTDKLGSALENYREELVDVIVMCQQMLLIDGIGMDEVNERAKAKLERALK